MNEKIKEIGENQLQPLVDNKKWDKKKQFYNHYAVARSRGDLYHKLLCRYCDEISCSQTSSIELEQRTNMGVAK